MVWIRESGRGMLPMGSVKIAMGVSVLMAMDCGIHRNVDTAGAMTEKAPSLYDASMPEFVTGHRDKIDLETWERRAVFQFFKSFTEPYHGVCLRVDCTETYRYAKQHRISVFLWTGIW